MGSGLSMTSVNKIKELAASREYDMAVEILDSQDLTKSLNPQFLRTCGKIYTEVGRYTDARRVLLMAHKLGPEGRRVIYSLIYLYLKLGYKKLADKYFGIYMHEADEENIDTRQLEYIMKKAERVELSELEQYICDYYIHNLDYEWSFEVVLLYLMQDKINEAKEIAADYKALYKDTANARRIDELMQDKNKVKELFDVFYSEEVEDDEAESEELRREEKILLEQDELRIYPKEPEITIMVDDPEQDEMIGLELRYKHFLRKEKNREKSKENKAKNKEKNKLGSLFKKKKAPDEDAEQEEEKLDVLPDATEAAEVKEDVEVPETEAAAVEIEEDVEAPETETVETVEVEENVEASETETVETVEVEEGEEASETEAAAAEVEEGVEAPETETVEAAEVKEDVEVPETEAEEAVGVKEDVEASETEAAAVEIEEDVEVPETEAEEAVGVKEDVEASETEAAAVEIEEDVEAPETETVETVEVKEGEVAPEQEAETVNVNELLKEEPDMKELHLDERNSKKPPTISIEFDGDFEAESETVEGLLDENEYSNPFESVRGLYNDTTYGDEYLKKNNSFMFGGRKNNSENTDIKDIEAFAEEFSGDMAVFKAEPVADDTVLEASDEQIQEAEPEHNEYADEPVEEAEPVRNEYADKPVEEAEPVRNEYADEPVEEAYNEYADEPVEEVESVRNIEQEKPFSSNITENMRKEEEMFREAEALLASLGIDFGTSGTKSVAAGVEKAEKQDFAAKPEKAGSVFENNSTFEADSAFDVKEQLEEAMADEPVSPAKTETRDAYMDEYSGYELPDLSGNELFKALKLNNKKRDLIKKIKAFK